MMISYLDYSNHFFMLQKEIEKNSDKQLKFNKISLIIFIIGLIFSNILIMTSCLILLRIFQSNIEKKIIVMKRLLKKQNNIDKLIERINLVKDLIKFYSKPPMETITKLSINMKKQDKKKNKSNLSNNKEINKDENDLKGYSLFFILKKFLILLIILNSIYILYSLIFVKVSNDSFSLLQNVMTIIYNSAYGEDLTYMMIGIAQLLQYISIPLIITQIFLVIYLDIIKKFIYMKKEKKNKKNLFLLMLKLLTLIVIIFLLILKMRILIKLLIIILIKIIYNK